MRRIRNLLISLLLLLLCGMAVLYLFRNSILNTYLDNFKVSFNKKYKGSFVYASAELSGFTRLSLTGIKVLSPSGDSLFRADSVFVAVNPFSIIFREPLIREIDVLGVRISLFKKGGEDNYLFLLRPEKGKENSRAVYMKSYSETASGAMRLLFEKIPAVISFYDVSVSYLEDSSSAVVEFPSLIFRDEQFQALVVSGNSRWKAEGVVDSRKKILSIGIAGERGHPVYLPYITQKFGAVAAFDSLQFSLSPAEEDGKTFAFRTSCRLKNLRVNHWRISPVDAAFSTIGLNALIRTGDTWLELDSASTASIGAISITPYLRYHPQHGKEITLRAKFDSLDAGDFFSSLPSGIFRTLEGIKTSGRLSYRLDFHVNLSNPDSLKFSSHLSKDQFRILDFGETYFPRINEPFEYTAYEKGIPVRTFTVGPENSRFTPLDKISPYLKNSVLTSEDGGFFWHRGFNEEAFAEAIGDNIKEKRFARGGSTITMQLVKNVFLNRNKTISRKLEEAIIVWLIENNKLCSKERMFEVYLNIIEWGPDVYGIGEAAEFYFAKKPSELTLEESIFLSSIIPHPKWFRFSFDKQGKLKPYLENYYRLLSGIMLRRQQITLVEHDRLKPEISLKGPAKSMIVIADTSSSMPDSLLLRDVNRLPILLE